MFALCNKIHKSRAISDNYLIKDLQSLLIKSDEKINIFSMLKWLLVLQVPNCVVAYFNKNFTCKNIYNKVFFFTNNFLSLE